MKTRLNIIFNKINNNRFLTIIISTYILLTIVMPGKALQSVLNSLYYIKEMILIMPVILLLTSLIEAWVPKKTIENTLGKNSGTKGIIFSFLLGSFSAGPIYAAFPVCKTLMKKGANIFNIIIILSSWAVIKVPMLVNETKFLGLKFMGIRWILTSVAILFIGYISSKIIKNKDIPMLNNVEALDENTYLTINKNYCIGCGMCAKLLPKQFVIKNKKAIVLNKISYIEANEDIKNIIDKCPAKAIEFKKNYKL